MFQAESLEPSIEAIASSLCSRRSFITLGKDLVSCFVCLFVSCSHVLAVSPKFDVYFKQRIKIVLISIYSELALASALETCGN